MPPFPVNPGTHFSDEIGHFEFCATGAHLGRCNHGNANDPAGSDDDEAPCFSALDSLLVPIGGCIGTDVDFDGIPYQPASWPGSGGSKPVSTPITFTSPLFNGGQNYDRIAFEADLPRIEFATNPPCNRTTGANCVNPPIGADFYPQPGGVLYRFNDFRNVLTSNPCPS